MGAVVAIAPTPVAVAEPASPFEVVAEGLLNRRGLTFGSARTARSTSPKPASGDPVRASLVPRVARCASVRPVA